MIWYPVRSRLSSIFRALLCPLCAVWAQESEVAEVLKDADPRFLDCSDTEHNGAHRTFREHTEEQKMAQGPPRVLVLFNPEGIIRSCSFIPFDFNGDVHRLPWTRGRKELTP